MGGVKGGRNIIFAIWIRWKIEVVMKDETIRTTQKVIASLFDIAVPGINKHQKSIF